MSAISNDGVRSIAVTAVDSPPPAPVSSEPRLPWIWSVATWICFFFTVAATMIATKMAQRMIMDCKAWDAALHDAILTRGRNHSAFLLLANCLAIIWFALAFRHKYRRASIRLGRWGWGAVGALTLALCGMYLHKVATAPDPGTFFANYTGWAYVVQFIEGCVNLTVFASFALWIVAAWRIVTLLDTPDEPTPWEDRPVAWTLLTAAVMPVLVYTVYTAVLGTEWLHKGWGIGNKWPGLLGYTFLMAAPNLIVAGRVWLRTAHRISLRDLVELFTKGGPRAG